MKLKQIFRRTLNYLHLDVTKNLEYDRLTHQIIRQSLKNNSNCIDVGCHKGEILDTILEYAPNGNHHAFEPIPSFFDELHLKYSDKVKVYPFALANEAGTAMFNYVKNAPAYSGLQKRDYAVSSPEIEKIHVEVQRLDELIPQNLKIDFLKIDVEGAEFGVIKGAKRLLTEDRPLILFECGLGASNHYGTQPQDIFDFLSDIGYKIYLLKDFVQNKTGLSREGFISIYEGNKEYYFVAK
jgi:FkbM family methyltransferase